MKDTIILITADSRGAGLENCIKLQLQKDYPNDANRIKVTVRSMGGATTGNIITKMDERYPNPPKYDMIMTFVGVNNLTNKVYEGKVEPVNENVSEIMEETTDSYTKLKEDLKDRCPHIVISQIVGIYIDAYNKYVNEGRWFYQRNELNMSMPLLAL